MCEFRTIVCFEWKYIFNLLIKIKVNNNGGARHNIQTNSSLSNDYYPTINTQVGKPFIFVIHKWDMCQKKLKIFSTYMLLKTVHQILSIKFYHTFLNIVSNKWHFISMCLVLEFWIGFFVKQIATVLLQKIGVLLPQIWESSNWYFIQSSCVQQLATEMYYASALEKSIVACLLLALDIRFSPMNWQFSLVEILSILSLT